MNESSTFHIPKDVIEPIIQAHVTAAVASALAGKEHLVSEAISAVLNRKVDSSGTPSTYSSSVSWMQWVMDKCIQEATQKAIEEALITHGETLKKTLITELQRKNSPLAKQLVGGLMNALTDKDLLRYRITVAHESPR